MGSALSSRKSKRKEKKEHKRKLREQLKEAEEYLARLVDQLQLQNELLDHYQRSRIADGSGPGTETVQADRGTIEMVEEIEALERKLFIEEIALNVTEDRCDFLDNNYSLLQNNETNLHLQRAACPANLEALIVRHEASQFARFKRQNPVEEWVVCSLPNLYL